MEFPLGQASHIDERAAKRYNRYGTHWNTFQNMPNQVSESRADNEFAKLLEHHLSRGTRPQGSPKLIGKAWSHSEFARAVSTNERTVRNWKNGRAVPNSIKDIELALFGDRREYDEWRQELRDVHNRSRLTPGPKAAGYSKASPLNSFGLALYEWMSVDHERTTELSSILCGNYIVYRKSMNEKSAITQSNLSISESNGILIANHVRLYRVGVVERSEGIVVGDIGSLHILLKTKNSNIIQFMALRCLTKDIEVSMTGFLQTVDTHGKRLVSKIFIRHSTNSDFLVEQNMSESDKERFFDLEKHLLL